MSGSPEIVIYHDKAARDRKLQFKSQDEADLPKPVPRAQKVQTIAHEVAESYFDREFRDHTGRPDVIVLEIKNEATQNYEYLITEVKNSKREKTIRQGIKEALEYLAFLQVNEEYVFGREERSEEYFGDGWNGLLVVQDLDRETKPFEKQKAESQPIRILQASEIEDGIRETLLRLGID